MWIDCQPVVILITTTQTLNSLLKNMYLTSLLSMLEHVTWLLACNNPFGYYLSSQQSLQSPAHKNIQNRVLERVAWLLASDNPCGYSPSSPQSLQKHAHKNTLPQKETVCQSMWPDCQLVITLVAILQAPSRQKHAHTNILPQAAVRKGFWGASSSNSSNKNLLVKKATTILLKLCALSHLVVCASLASFEQISIVAGRKTSQKTSKIERGTC